MSTSSGSAPAEGRNFARSDRQFHSVLDEFQTLMQSGVGATGRLPSSMAEGEEDALTMNDPSSLEARLRQRRAQQLQARDNLNITQTPSAARKLALPHSAGQKPTTTIPLPSTLPPMPDRPLSCDVRHSQQQQRLYEPHQEALSDRPSSSHHLPPLPTLRSTRASTPGPDNATPRGGESSRTTTPRGTSGRVDSLRMSVDSARSSSTTSASVSAGRGERRTIVVDAARMELEQQAEERTSEMERRAREREERRAKRSANRATTSSPELVPQSSGGGDASPVDDVATPAAEARSSPAEAAPTSEQVAPTPEPKQEETTPTADEVERNEELSQARRNRERLAREKEELEREHQLALERRRVWHIVSDLVWEEQVERENLEERQLEAQKSFGAWLKETTKPLMQIATDERELREQMVSLESDMRTMMALGECEEHEQHVRLRILHRHNTLMQHHWMNYITSNLSMVLLEQHSLLFEDSIAEPWQSTVDAYRHEMSEALLETVSRELWLVVVQETEARLLIEEDEKEFLAFIFNGCRSSRQLVTDFAARVAEAQREAREYFAQKQLSLFDEESNGRFIIFRTGTRDLESILDDESNTRAVLEAEDLKKRQEAVAQAIRDAEEFARAQQQAKYPEPTIEYQQCTPPPATRGSKSKPAASKAPAPKSSAAKKAPGKPAVSRNKK